MKPSRCPIALPLITALGWWRVLEAWTGRQRHPQDKRAEPKTALQVRLPTMRVVLLSTLPCAMRPTN